MADLRDGVSLTELGVITRWSLAVRQPAAERADLIAELRADLAWLEGAQTRSPESVPESIVEPDEPDEPQRGNDLTQEIVAQTPLRRLPRKTTPAPAKIVAKAAPSKTAKAPAPAKVVAKAAPSKAPRGRRPAAKE